MYCNKNKLLSLPFFGPHSKHHDAMGLSNNYYLRFNAKLGNGVYKIRCIPCYCVASTTILDKTWISGIL